MWTILFVVPIFISSQETTISTEKVHITEFLFAIVEILNSKFKKFKLKLTDRTIFDCLNQYKLSVSGCQFVDIQCEMYMTV